MIPGVYFATGARVQLAPDAPCLLAPADRASKSATGHVAPAAFAAGDEVQLEYRTRRGGVPTTVPARAMRAADVEHGALVYVVVASAQDGRAEVKLCAICPDESADRRAFDAARGRRTARPGLIRRR